MTEKQSVFIDYLNKYLDRQCVDTCGHNVRISDNEHANVDSEHMCKRDKLLCDLDETCVRYQRIKEQMPCEASKLAMLESLARHAADVFVDGVPAKPVGLDHLRPHQF